MTSPLDDLRDAVARQDEHSHVDAETRERIRQIIEAGDEREHIAVTAGRIVAELSPAELAQLATDWLEHQIAI